MSKHRAADARRPAVHAQQMYALTLCRDELIKQTLPKAIETDVDVTAFYVSSEFASHFIALL